jgi:hypothetical protein
VAIGALLRREVAVFALPRHVELRSDMRLHVLISPVGPRYDDVIERVLPHRVSVMSLVADPQAKVAVVRLANPSRYAGPDSERSEIGARLASFMNDPAAMDGETLSHALEQAGLLPGEPSGAPVERVLADIVRIELVQVRNMITVRLSRSPAEILSGLLHPEGSSASPSMIDPRDGLALASG